MDYLATFDDLTNPDPKDRATLVKLIAKADSVINDMNKAIDNKLAEAKKENPNTTRAEVKGSMNLSKYLHQHQMCNIAMVILAKDYYFVNDKNSFIRFGSSQTNNKSGAMWKKEISLPDFKKLLERKYLPKDNRRIKDELFIYDATDAVGRAYNEETYSNQNNLDSDILNRMAIQKRHWTQPIPYEGDDDKVDLIKLLFRSVSGGSDSNYNHLCEWFYWLYNNPQDAPLLPCINIHGMEGSGKNLLHDDFCTTLFTTQAWAYLHFDGNFNGELAGKMLVILNEVQADKRHMNKAKEMMGAKSIRIEAKCKDAVTSENVSAFMAFTNSEFSSFLLSQDKGENRRVSILKCERSLKMVVREHLQLTGEPTDEDVKIYINKIVKALNSRSVVGKFLHYLNTNHAVANRPQAHHGEDYNALLELQKNATATTLDFLAQDNNFTGIPAKYLKELIAASKGVAPKELNDKTIKQHISTWLSNHQDWDYYYKNKTTGKDTRVKFDGKKVAAFARKGLASGYNLNLDYFKYFDESDCVLEHVVDELRGM